MRRWLVVMFLLIFVGGWVSVGSAKSDIWDIINKIPGGDQQQPTPAPGQKGQEGGTAYIKLVTGEVFTIDTQGADLNQLEFQGTLRIEQPDATYYINSAQVAYVKVPAQR